VLCISSCNFRYKSGVYQLEFEKKIEGPEQISQCFEVTNAVMKISKKRAESRIFVEVKRTQSDFPFDLKKVKHNKNAEYNNAKNKSEANDTWAFEVNVLGESDLILANRRMHPKFDDDEFNRAQFLKPGQTIWLEFDLDWGNELGSILSTSRHELNKKPMKAKKVLLTSGIWLKSKNDWIYR